MSGRYKIRNVSHIERFEATGSFSENIVGKLSCMKENVFAGLFHDSKSNGQCRRWEKYLHGREMSRRRLEKEIDRRERE